MNVRNILKKIDFCEEITRFFSQKNQELREYVTVEIKKSWKMKNSSCFSFVCFLKT